MKEEDIEKEGRNSLSILESSVLNHQESSRSFRPKLAELMLEEGLDQDIARSILNGDPLFDHERSLVVERFNGFLTNTVEIVDLFFIDSVYSYLGARPSSAAKASLDRIVVSLLKDERQMFDEFFSRESLEIEGIQRNISTHQVELDRNYRLAHLSFIIVLIGVVLIFWGFGRVDWPLVGIGIFFLFPVVLITDSKHAMVQFRSDIRKIAHVEILRTRIDTIENSIALKRERIEALQARSFKDESVEKRI